MSEKITKGGPVSISLDAPVENTWTRKNDLPISMTNAEACTYDGYVYIFHSNAVYKYNPVEDTYIKLNNSPLHSNKYHRAVEYEGFIYVLDYNGFFKYDPEGDVWSTLPKPTTYNIRHGSVFVEYEGELYTFGSANTSGISSAEKYNISNNTWTRIADMPIGTGYWDGVVLDGECHMIGGEWNYNNIHLIYNFKTNTYTRKTMPNSNFHYSRCEVIDDEIYVYGGYNNYNHCYVYINGEWIKKADVPVGIDMFASAVVDGYIYTFGGDNGYPSRVYQYYTGYEPPSMGETTFYLYEIEGELYKEVEGELVKLDGVELSENTMITYGTHSFDKDLLASLPHVKLHIYEQDPSVVEYNFNYTMLYKGQLIVQGYDFNATNPSKLIITATVNADDIFRVLLSNDSGENWYTFENGEVKPSSLDLIEDEGISNIQVNSLLEQHLMDFTSETGKLRLAIYMKQARSSVKMKLNHIRLEYKR